MKKLLLCCLVLASFATPHSVRAAEPKIPTVRVAINTWMGYVPLFVAKEKGLFKGINVETFLNDDIAVAYAAYDSGQVDILYASIDMMPVMLNHGRRGKCFFVSDSSWGSDGVVAAPAVRTVADLKGKRVAFVPGCYSHWMLYLMLKSVGMDLRAIKKVEVDTATSAANALVSGSVDAAVTYQPYMGQIAQSGKGHLLKTSRDYADLMPSVWVATEKLLADRPTVDAFVEGWLRGILYMEQHREEAEQIAARGFHISVQDVRESMRGVRYSNPAENRKFLVGPEAQGPKIYDESAALYLAEGVIRQKPPAASEVFTDQAAPVFERMARLFKTSK